jgi:DNA/RNA-binding domain of Phe-tRNA-synthetase-like protein
MSNALLTGTDRWRDEHRGSSAAVVLYHGLSAGDETAALAVMKRDLEAELRARWGSATRQELLSDPTLAAYQRHDQRFGQNYHVAMQIMSIAQKGKSIPNRNPLIEAMFMTELKSGVLASAQDADQIALPIAIDSADGSEQYIRYDGVEERCKAGDQLMRDANGEILTSIAQGPTAFGLVSPDTTSVAYCFYFPAGVQELAITESIAYLDQCVRAACSPAEQAARPLSPHSCRGLPWQTRVWAPIPLPVPIRYRTPGRARLGSGRICRGKSLHSGLSGRGRG